MVVLVQAGEEEEHGAARPVEARVVRGRPRIAPELHGQGKLPGGVGDQLAQALAAVDPADVQPTVAQAPDHVEIEHEGGLLDRPRRAGGVVR